MKRTMLAMLAATTCAIALSAPQGAKAADADLSCKLHYNITGWALIYKHTAGTGTVTCANGQSMRVHVGAKAVGLTAGKWHIDDGKGDFTDVHHISDVLGDYVQASANAGVVKSGEAQVLTKGPVSLALAGNGEGVNIGVDIGKLTISR
ncbi:MAG TPA: hypothetical protein VGH80_13325 [Xanthomonadaceae bacterium]|jgi:hypothetical protein